MKFSFLIFCNTNNYNTIILLMQYNYANFVLKVRIFEKSNLKKLLYALVFAF